MKAPRSRLATVIDERINASMSAQDLSQEVAAYLLQEGRTGELDSVMRDVMQLRAERGIIEVIATDAFPLNDQARQDIEAALRHIYPEAQKIIISEVRDANIIGGTKLVLANQQLDVSIRSKLNRFKQLTVVTGGA